MSCRLKLIVCGLIFAITVPVHAEECEDAVRLTREANSLPLQKRVNAYQSARIQCPSDPTAHYRAGMALMAASQHAEAKSAFEDALAGVIRVKGESKYRLEILGRLAENAYRKGDRSDALIRFKVARGFAMTNDVPLPSWISPIQMDLDQQLDSNPLSVDEMKSSLKGMKSFGIEPSVDYRVMFDTDSERLTGDAEQQLQKIAESLMLGSDRVQVVGHTDIRGNEVHNQMLSGGRALSVVRWLASHYPDMAERLSSVGKGKSEPKYPGVSDEDNRMNRRVEFVFVRN